MKRLAPWLACIGLSLPACIVTTHDDDYGYLVVDWSLDRYQDSDVCFDFAAEEIAIQVSSSDGSWSAEYFQDCDAFSTSIELVPGRYFATAVLLDGAELDRTTAVNLGSFSLYGDDELIIPIDFPASSFY